LVGILRYKIAYNAVTPTSGLPISDSFNCLKLVSLPAEHLRSRQMVIRRKFGIADGGNRSRSSIAPPSIANSVVNRGTLDLAQI
jgi:hypothetical protein